MEVLLALVCHVLIRVELHHLLIFQLFVVELWPHPHINMDSFIQLLVACEAQLSMLLAYMSTFVRRLVLPLILVRLIHVQLGCRLHFLPRCSIIHCMVRNMQVLLLEWRFLPVASLNLELLIIGPVCIGIQTLHHTHILFRIYINYSNRKV